MKITLELEEFKIGWIVFAEMPVNVPIWRPRKHHKWKDWLPNGVEFRYRMSIFTINQGELYQVK